MGLANLAVSFLSLSITYSASRLAVDVFLVMIPTAGGLASLARLGHIIGRSHAGIRSAIVSVRAIYAIMMCLACVTAVLMIAFRGPLARLFTEDDETSELIREVLVPMATYQIWDYVSDSFRLI